MISQRWDKLDNSFFENFWRLCKVEHKNTSFCEWNCKSQTIFKLNQKACRVCQVLEKLRSFHFDTNFIIVKNSFFGIIFSAKISFRHPPNCNFLCDLVTKLFLFIGSQNTIYSVPDFHQKEFYLPRFACLGEKSNRFCSRFSAAKIMEYI